MKGMAGTVTVDLNGTWAREIYERNKQAEVIRLRVTEVGWNIEHFMSVSDAEKLAQDLIEWTREVKPYSELEEEDGTK